MATLTLTTPVRVGDLVNGITISSLKMTSFSVNFQGTTAVFSIVMTDPVSGYTYTETLIGAQGQAAWTAFQQAFPNFAVTVVNYLVGNSELPAGTVSNT